MLLLGVNIDHIATVRNARGEDHPDPIEAALIAEANGADGITAHLREDRRHIRDADMKALRKTIKTRLNMEMANTPEMVEIALQTKPDMVTLVPERREELTTEGGLNVITQIAGLKATTHALQKAGILVSLFIGPDIKQVDASKQTGATYIELHTGVYANAFTMHGGTPERELHALTTAATHAVEIGLNVNAGHGLNLQNVQPICSLPGLIELNIGHSIVSRALFVGFDNAVAEMKQAMNP